MYADECKAVPNGYEETIEAAKKLAKKLISENAHTKLEIVKEVANRYRCNTFGLKEAKEIVDEAYEEFEKQSLHSNHLKALKIAKESLQKGESKLVAIKNILDECGHLTHDSNKTNGFSLKQAKDIVDEAQLELMHPTEDPERKVPCVDFSQVRRDMDLYAELVEKIEGLEAQIRLITNMYPYIEFPRYAREPSQPTTQK